MRTELPPCSCSAAGWCERYKSHVNEHRKHLCETRPKYRELWDKLAEGPISAPPTPPPEPPPACVHRGEKVREDRCRLAVCVGGPVVDVFACAVHGECTLNQHAIPGVKVCRKCEDRATEIVPRGPVRVVFFTPGLLGGGAERWIVTLCKLWRTDVGGTGVVLADWAGSEPGMVDELQRCGVAVYGSDKLPKDAANAPQVKRFPSLGDAARAALAEADVVISWGWGDVHQVLADAGWLGPHVVVSHGSCDWSKRLLNGPSRAATHLAAVSEAAAQSFPEDQRDRVKVLWNGIEVDRIVPSRDRWDVRGSWGCGREMLVGYLGRHAVSKRPEAVALAVAELRRRGISAKGVWIGAGTHTAQVKRTCEGIAPGACVWVDPPDHVGDALAALNCLVLASPSEGMSLALCEAWAAELPTVATPVGAVPELHRDFGPLCEVVPVGADAVQLADAVMRATGAGNRHRVRYAREITLREFSAARMARRWADWLGEIQRNTITASVRGSIATRTP